MREEMLKRLDEIIADTIRASGGRVPTGWVRFRSELEIERCENCEHWGAVTHVCTGAEAQDAKFAVTWWADGNDEEGGAQFETEPDFSCVHFTRKPAKP